jgi:RNA methyltransferase, TrmH family
MLQRRPWTSQRPIESPHASVLKVFRRSLAEGLTREGWLAIEGPILFEEALAAGGYLGERKAGAKARPLLRSVLATESQAQRFGASLDRLPCEVELNLVSDALFERVTQTQTPQGIAAFVELPPHDPDAAMGRGDALMVVACGLQDPGNLGAILRSAQALGGTALASLRNTVSPFNPKTVRSSAGAVFRLPIFPSQDPEPLMARLRRLGVAILATDRHSAVRICDADLRRPTAVLIGQEAAGLDSELMRGADGRVAIPIRTGMDSMNAAAAGSVILYEAARQRGFHFDEPL